MRDINNRELNTESFDKAKDGIDYAITLDKAKEKAKGEAIMEDH